MKANLVAAFAGSLALATLGASSHAASNLEAQAAALKIIRETAADICTAIATEGHSSTTELSGTAQAKRAGLLSKVADLGIDGSAKYTSSEYRNVLQSDLAKALTGMQDCKLTVFRTLQEKMLGPTR